MLTQLGKVFDVDLLLLTREPLRDEQRAALAACCRRIIRVPLRGATRLDKLLLACRSLYRRRPYHCSLIEASLGACPEVLEWILEYPGVVYASYGHWGTLVHRQDARNWILDQQHVATDFWRVYRAQTRNPFLKIAAGVNIRLATGHFRHVYPAVGQVVSVCDEDRELTYAVARSASVEVIANGVDCAHYAPAPSPRSGTDTLLFVGTSEPRNVTALTRVIRRILPGVQRQLPSSQLLVAGNIATRDQALFKDVRSAVFTGPVDDLRDAFNGTDVFVVPHTDTHGSQLKVAVAMAMGMPIVSTVQGIRGMPLVADQSVLTAADDEQFANAVVALLADADLRRRLGAAARAAALAHLDWPALGKRLVALVHQVGHGAGSENTVSHLREALPGPRLPARLHSDEPHPGDEERQWT